MKEKKLTEKQKEDIEKIKEEWANEITPLFEKWDREENELRKKNPDAPRILDKHLKEQAEIEKKYRDKIQEIIHMTE